MVSLVHCKEGWRETSAALPASLPSLGTWCPRARRGSGGSPSPPTDLYAKVGPFPLRVLFGARHPFGVALTKQRLFSAPPPLKAVHLGLE